MTPDEIVKAVQDWYGDYVHWAVSAGNLLTVHKTKECIDWKLIRQGDFIKDKIVLNIGCYFPGDEITFSHLAKKWIAIDFTEEVIKRCKELAIQTVDFIHMDARKLTFSDSEFDLVFDFSSGDQMPEEHYNEVLGEIFRVLKPGGKFIVTFANYDYFRVKETEGDFGYARIYSVEELIEKIQSFGFHLEEVDGIHSDRAGMIWTKI